MATRPPSRCLERRHTLLSRDTSPTALRLPASRQPPAPHTRGRRRRRLRRGVACVLGGLGGAGGPGLSWLAGSWVGASAIAGDATADIREGLVAEYRFDESSGTVAADSSGHHFDGRLVGTPQWVPGYYGNGLKLDGRQDYVYVEHREALNVS